MPSQNSFSINLNQQQTIAKARLEKISQGDEHALEQVKSIIPSLKLSLLILFYLLMFNTL